jgi:hypothetical protein
VSVSFQGAVPHVGSACLGAAVTVSVSAALALAGDGYRIFPLVPGEKLPDTKNGCLDATQDEEQIRQWWRRRPLPNVGVATGHGGLVVLDVDHKDGRDGPASLKLLEQRLGELPLTRTVITPSGGAHYYFLGGDGIRNSAGALAVGIDVRGAGGFVVGPGSTFDGKPYLLEDGSPQEATLPDLWRDALLQASRSRDAVPEPGEQIPRGKRNDKLFHVYARGLRDLSLTEAEILDCLRIIEHARCEPDPDETEDGREKEIAKIAHSAASREGRGIVVHGAGIGVLGESPTTGALLEEVRAILRRYLILPAEYFYDVAALWVLHTHAIAAFDITVRWIFKSPEKESGKTRGLETFELLVPAPLFAINASTPAIFRLLKEEHASLLFDEVDAIFNPKAGNYEDLRAMINAGYSRGATVARVVGEGSKMHTERFPVYAALALACIGDLPDTIESRAIIVPMRRRAPNEHVEQFRRRRVIEVIADIRGRLARWGVEHIDELAAADPVMPEELTDRAADCWEPLLAIADLAGEEWPARAREAAVLVVKGRVAEDASTGVRLLADIQVVMDGRDRMSSASLCAALNELEESGWGGWNAGKGIGQRDLARRLKRYGIESKNVRLGDGSIPKGYLHSDFDDAFARYLRVSPPPIKGATSATSATQTQIDVADVADVAPLQGAGEAG